MINGKYGRIPRDTTRFAPTLEHYFVDRAAGAGLEAVPDSMDVDRASLVNDWPMYLNGPDPANPPASPDGIGDCTIAGQAHGFTAMSAFSGQGQPLFAPAEIIKAYSAVSGYDPKTGANDNGAQLQDVLKYAMTTGMPDVNGKTHKVVSYAALGDPTNITLLSDCLKTFGFVYTGINCPDSAQSEFGEIWTYVPGSPIDGGHCIGLHRRFPYGFREGVFDFSTWGALQYTTIGFIQNYVEEAWVFTTADWIEANGASCDGIALAALEADMKYV